MINNTSYTDEQLKNLLQYKSGTRETSFRLELLNDKNQPLGELDFLPEGQVSIDSTAELKRSASFTIRKSQLHDIDLLQDRLRPSVWVRLPNGQSVSWPLGVFLLSSPSNALGSKQGGRQYNSVNGFDICLALQEDKLVERASFAAGTPYIEIIRDMIAGAGINLTRIDDSALELASAREFESGKDKLSIINELLTEMNYVSLYTDAEGFLCSNAYVPATRREVAHHYKTDGASVIAAGGNISLDTYQRPNVIVVTVSNPDVVEMRAMRENNAPESPISIPSRGRKIVKVETVNNVASLSELEAYADKLLEESAQIYETVTLPTAIMPDHNINDIVELNYTDEISGVFEEIATSYSFNSKTMSHTLRRVVHV